MIDRRRPLVAAAVWLASLGASQAHAAHDWPMYRGTPAQDGVAPGAIPDAPELLWTHVVGQAIASSPVVAGDTVYFGADDGLLHAVALKDGVERWTFKTQDMIEAAPIVVDGRVVVGSSDGFLYSVVAADGTLAWKHETAAQILGSANWLQGADGRTRIVVGSYDATLYCLDAETGEQLWTYVTEDRINGSPAVLDGSIVIGGCDTNLHVVSGVTGEAEKQIPMGAACHIAAAAGLKDGDAYFGHYGNEFVRLSLETGEVVWRHSHPTQAFFSPPAIGDDVVLFGGRDKQVHCVDRATGAERWATKARRNIDTGPVLCGDRVVVTAGDGRVRILALDDGREIWSYDIGKPILASPAVAHGRILVGANDGNLYCFGSRPDDR